MSDCQSRSPNKPPSDRRVIFHSCDSRRNSRDRRPRPAREQSAARPRSPPSSRPPHCQHAPRRYGNCSHGALRTAAPPAAVRSHSNPKPGPSSAVRAPQPTSSTPATRIEPVLSCTVLLTGSPSHIHPNTLLPSRRSSDRPDSYYGVNAAAPVFLETNKKRRIPIGTRRRLRE